MTPAVLQTSPYLTCIRPHDPSPIVYMTDSRGATYPEIGDPGDATYGVIGLDRQVVWQRDLDGLRALEAAATWPVATDELVRRYGAAVVEDLVARRWLQALEDLCKEYYLRSAQIEITAHCNWRCEYCPVAKDPKPKATMPIELFEEIITKIAGIDTIVYVTFHFYNEPTLDPLFVRRIELLAKHGLKLSLFTNGSTLSSDKIQLLEQSGVLHHLVVNLPTVDPDRFREMTGSTTFQRSQSHLDQAIGAGLRTSIVVNGTDEELRRSLPVLRETYEPRGVEVRVCGTCDRAGALINKYNQGVAEGGRLRGCSWPLNHIYFSVAGDVFICPNDYYQREVYGHIRDGSIHDIMTGSRAIALRRRVFGVDIAPATYVCRSCHDQRLDFPHRQFRPLASFPVLGE